MIEAPTTEELLDDAEERLIDTELLFLPGERTKPPAQTLTDAQNVERICIEFWQPTLAQFLGSGRRF